MCATLKGYPLWGCPKWAKPTQVRTCLYSLHGNMVTQRRRDHATRTNMCATLKRTRSGVPAAEECSPGRESVIESPALRHEGGGRSMGKSPIKEMTMMGKQLSLALGMAILLQVCVASFGQATQPSPSAQAAQPASRPGALAPVDLGQMIGEKALKQSLVGKRVFCVLRVDKVNDETKSPTPNTTAAPQESLTFLAQAGRLTVKDIVDAKNPSMTDMTDAKSEVDRRLAVKRSQDKGQEDSLSHARSTPGRNTNAEFSNLVARDRKQDGPLSELSNALANRIDDLNRFPYKVSGTAGAAKFPVIATISVTCRRILEKVKPGDEITLTGLIESVSPATAAGTFTVSLNRCECKGIVPPAPAAATPPASKPASQPGTAGN
jgi:hypothetical protein